MSNSLQTAPRPSGGCASICGKRVRYHQSRILNLNSGFRHKLLCDGPTFTAGTACAYRCRYCYVETMNFKNGAVRTILKEENARFEDLVIRRAGAVLKIEEELTDRKGHPKYTDPNDYRVVFGSPLVDICPTLELAEETTKLCMAILRLTNWQIRLLSKSPLLARVASAIPSEHKHRVIFGISTGTVADGVAAAIESGCPSVRMRLEALHWLQDNGYRTFAMLCPSLPQQDYNAFSEQICAAVRADRCEHVWAEVLNARGSALTRTCSALDEAGFGSESEALREISQDKAKWEAYARATFEAHARHIPAGKLRFLQYVTNATRPWWTERIQMGAVALGRHRAPSPLASQIAA